MNTLAFLFMNPNLFLSPYFCIALVRQLSMIHVNSTKHHMPYIMMFEVNMLNETTLLKVFM